MKNSPEYKNEHEKTPSDKGANETIQDNYTNKTEVNKMNFEHSESIKSILPAMIEVQSDMPQLSKDANNPHAKSKYLTLDNILGALTPLLNQQGILLTQIPKQRELEDGTIGIGVDTRFWHKSGEFVHYTGIYFDFEKGGRMNNTQSTGSILTYAKRYELTSIFGVSTNEDADGVQPAVQQRKPTERERKWEEFAKNREELFNRVSQLATESMQSTGKVNEAMLKRVSEEIGEKQTEITPENLSEYNKQLILAEINFKNSKAEKKKETDEAAEQSSMFEGGTTKPNIEWGN